MEAGTRDDGDADGQEVWDVDQIALRGATFAVIFSEAAEGAAHHGIADDEEVWDVDAIGLPQDPAEMYEDHSKCVNITEPVDDAAAGSAYASTGSDCLPSGAEDAQPSPREWSSSASRQFQIPSFSPSSSINGEMGPHPITRHTAVARSIRFIAGDVFLELPVPLPRCQDLPQACFGIPEPEDLVVAVSHAWRNQAHPDPCGVKVSILRDILPKVKEATTGNVWVFFDFVSIPQRPFREGQQDRTDDETALFKEALGCMHHVYMLSDRIVHLDVPDVAPESEGDLYRVPVATLRSAELALVGDWVQVLGVDNVSMGPQLATCSPCIALFDRLVSVDGQAATSSPPMADLDDASQERFAELVRMPFGRINEIPASDRGWIFLERFITGVKCAMLGDDATSDVVITNCPSILLQIEKSAAGLRAAASAPRDSKRAPTSQRLGEVLAEHLEALQEKRFSAASTDKLLIDGTQAINPDSLIVRGIMKEFVDHLGSHWHDEVSSQQRRNRRLLHIFDTAHEFLLQREFSPEWTSHIETAAGQHPWPLVALALAPAIPVMLLLLCPMPSPDAGWQQQIAFFLTFWLGAGATSAVFPAFLMAFGQIDWTPHSIRLSISWCIVCGGSVLALMIGLAAVLDTWPVPFAMFCAPIAASFLLGLLHWIVPLASRKDPRTRRQLRLGVVSLFTLMFIFCGFLPLLNIVMVMTKSMFWQLLIVFVFLLSVAMYEHFGAVLNRGMRADAIPNLRIVAANGYKMNVCINMCSVLSWPVFAELVAFNVISNVKSLWQLTKAEHLSLDSATGADAGASASVNFFAPRPSHLAEKRTGNTFSENKLAYVLADMLLRTVVSVVCPATFCVVLLTTAKFRPEPSQLLCRLSDTELERVVTFIVLLVLSEWMVAGFILAVLWHRGHRPFHLIRGLVRAYGPVLFTDACAAYVWFWFLQYTASGMDATLKFLWLHGDDNTWVCGLTWQLPQ